MRGNQHGTQAHCFVCSGDDGQSAPFSSEPPAVSAGLQPLTRDTLTFGAASKPPALPTDEEYNRVYLTAETVFGTLSRLPRKAGIGEAAYVYLKAVTAYKDLIGLYIAYQQGMEALPELAEDAPRKARQRQEGILDEARTRQMDVLFLLVNSIADPKSCPQAIATDLEGHITSLPPDARTRLDPKVMEALKKRTTDKPS